VRLNSSGSKVQFERAAMCYTEFCLQQSSVNHDRDGRAKTLVLRSGADSLKHLPMPEFRKATGFDMKLVQEEADAITAAGDSWVAKHGVQLAGDAKEKPLRFYVRGILRGLILVNVGEWAAKRLGDVCVDAAANLQVCEELRLRTQQAEARAMASAQDATALKSKLKLMEDLYSQLQEKLRLIEAVHEHEVS
jgi:hypothetical protein